MSLRSFRSAFTLVEVLVVIAITIILFGLLIRPLVDTLRYTKDAQLQAAAQDSARKVMEILTREIGSAAYVSDNSSHAFNAVTGKEYSTTSGVQTEQYSNFLNIEVPAVDLTTGAQIANGTLAHIYNAKLDLVMARHVSSTNPNLYDPTAGNEPVQFDKNSKSLNGEGGTRIVSTSLMFPLAPGTSMIRYFIGLKYPEGTTASTAGTYNNPRDHIFPQSGQHTDNTYVLYRAQFTPYTSSGANTDLFYVDPATGQPVLDDPDFFRMVSATDINWLDAAHGQYGPSGAASHNTRLENWLKIAKPIISAPEIDLLVMPHKSDRTLDYDTSTEMFPGVAHYGADHDPVTGTDYPIEHTSVMFMPGSASTDAAPSTTSDYQEQGIAGGAIGYNAGLPYIPTVYQTIGQAWTRPYFVYLYPQTGTNGALAPNTTDYFYISQALTTLADTSNPGTNLVTAGDVVEYHSTASGATPVFDLTSVRIVTSRDTDVIPAVVNEDQGTISFSIPAVPGTGNSNVQSPAANSYAAYNRQWAYTPPTADTSGNPVAYNQAAFTSPNILDLTQNDDAGDITPLNNYATNNNQTSSPISKYLSYAFIAPGSLRVYGPDMTTGPNSPGQTAKEGNTSFVPQQVLYTEVSGNATPGANQYQVDYFTGKITFAPLDQLETATKVTTQYYWPTGSKFSVIYDYQANMRPSDPTKPIAATTNPANPLALKVTYHSREYLDLAVGVRYLDSNGNSQNVLLSNSVKVGNINR